MKYRVNGTFSSPRSSISFPSLPTTVFTFWFCGTVRVRLESPKRVDSLEKSVKYQPSFWVPKSTCGIYQRGRILYRVATFSVELWDDRLFSCWDRNRDSDELSLKVRVKWFDKLVNTRSGLVDTIFCTVFECKSAVLTYESADSWVKPPGDSAINRCELENSWIIRLSALFSWEMCKNGTASTFFAPVSSFVSALRLKLIDAAKEFTQPATLKYGRLSWLWPLAGGAVNLKKSTRSAFRRPSAGNFTPVYEEGWPRKEVDRSFFFHVPFPVPGRKGAISRVVIRSAGNDRLTMVFSVSTRKLL